MGESPLSSLFQAATHIRHDADLQTLRATTLVWKQRILPEFYLLSPALSEALLQS